jgi:hypothetical protein
MRCKAVEHFKKHVFYDEKGRFLEKSGRGGQVQQTKNHPLRNDKVTAYRLIGSRRNGWTAKIMVAKGVILVLSCLGVIQALLLCVYLFSLRDRRSNLLLAFLLLSLTVRIGKSVVHVYLNLDPRVRNLAIATVLATGPLLWLYGKALLEKQAFSTRQYLHLVPFGLYFLLSPFIPNDSSLLSRVLYPSVLLHQTVYLVVSWFYLFKVPAGTRLKSWYRNIVIGVSTVLLV